LFPDFKIDIGRSMMEEEHTCYVIVQWWI
jgi:hypothetical protein